MRYRATGYGFDCAAAHGDETCILIVLGPAKAVDPLGADLVEEDRVDVDRKAIGGGVNHTINHPARLQVDCQPLQLHILSGIFFGKQLLGPDLGREVIVLPVNLEVALGAGDPLRGDDPAVLNICLDIIRFRVRVRVYRVRVRVRVRVGGRVRVRVGGRVRLRLRLRLRVRVGSPGP